MTSQDKTDRMIEFFGSEEAEEYAAKAQLRFAPVFVVDEHDRQAVGAKLREQVDELYELFDETGDDQEIVVDVPDLDLVDWVQLADLVILD